MDSHRRMLLNLDAIQENMRKEESWIIAAGHVDMMVACVAEKPNPLTIWLENYLPLLDNTLCSWRSCTDLVCEGCRHGIAAVNC